jgi:multidrug efflux pump
LLLYPRITLVTLSDIAEIRRTYKDQQTRTFYNGNPALILKVKRKTGTNVLEMTEQVRDRTKEYTANWPENINVNFSFDQSSHVFEMINSLQSSIVNAIVLVMLIVIGTLGFRSAMMVGIAIPTSFMMSFVLLSLFGNSLNMMVMFSLILCVGILVDSSIVIVEYADRKMAEGLDRKEAYARSAERMFFPILSSTATTLAAFTPLLFWPGVSGEFMSYLPRTLIFVLTSSLVMALFFLPAIGGLYGKTEQSGDPTLAALSADNPTLVIDKKTLTGRYLLILERLMVNPLRTFVALMLIFASIIMTYRFFEKDTLYFAEIEPRQAIVLVRARGNLSLDDTEKLTRSIEKEVMQIKGIQAALTQFGPNIAYGDSGNNVNPTDLIGSIFIEFQHFTVRESSTKIIQKIKDRTKDFPGIIVEVREQEDGPPIGKDIQLEIRSNNYEGLIDIAEKANAKFKSLDELLTDVEDNRSSPGIEWKIKVDREKAGLFGADISTVGAMVQMITNGVELGTYRPIDADDEVEIRIRYPEEYRDIKNMDSLRVNTPLGSVPISNFVDRTADQRKIQIDRTDGYRQITVKANVLINPVTNEKYPIAEAVTEIQLWLEEQDFGPEYLFRFRGSSEEEEAAAGFLGNAMLGGLALMFIILLLQFNSFYYAILTLTTVASSSIGVLIGLMMTGEQFIVVFSGVGIVALAGIVVNNSIVLIDTHQRLEKSGMDLKEAVLRAAGQRIRPILITTGTTIIGLLPMAMGTSINIFTRSIELNNPISAWWTNMSISIVFGLGFSTVLTLITIPVLIMLPNYLRNEIFPKFKQQYMLLRNG